MSPQIALQTFTIRRFLKSSAAIDASFARICAMGLQAVELAYVKLKPEYIDALQAAGKAHGIHFGSSQITFGFLDKRRDWVTRFHHQLECDISAVSVLPMHVIRGNKDTLLRFAQQLDELGSWYRQQGIQLCFHHHDFEFRRYGEELGIDLIMANTDPAHVGLELDTYWVQRGGRSAHTMINDLNGRVKVVHLRDYTLRRRLLELLPTDTELGQGNLDLTRIIAAAREKSVRYLAIEQATSTPFESVSKSVQHLHKLGFSTLF